jgi:hypothetical protein
MVSDGEITNCDIEANKMKRISKNRKNTMLLMEIGGTCSLGEAVKDDPNIIYHQVHDKEKMLREGLKCSFVIEI